MVHFFYNSSIEKTKVGSFLQTKINCVFMLVLNFRRSEQMCSVLAQVLVLVSAFLQIDTEKGLINLLIFFEKFSQIHIC